MRKEWRPKKVDEYEQRIIQQNPRATIDYKCCKVCKESKTLIHFPEYKAGKFRHTCRKRYSEIGYNRELLKAYDKTPWRYWSCVECDTINSVTHSDCRKCKKHTRQESLDEEVI